MAEKDHDGPDTQQKEDSCGRGDDPKSADNSSDILNREAIAHLQVAWEQFCRHVSTFARGDELSDRQPVIDDLLRIRNMLVVMEKNASRFVIEELLAVLRHDADRDSSTGELAKVLFYAGQCLGGHFRRMQADADIDNALALVSLVNDCRAYRDEMLLSDVLMLAAGIELPEAPFVSVSEKTWSDQRNMWVSYASSNHLSLVQRLLHWWRGERAGSAGPLIRHLDRFSTLSEKHGYLNSLTPLFQAASLVANAVKDGQIDDGPAIRSLYAQLERNVHRCALVAAPEDLVPGDLLRNFLYYVAQIETDATAAVNLRRRFRLDRVRQIALSTHSTSTPTIGVGYHLTSAIRNGVTRETESLRIWLDEPHNRQDLPKLVRLRVRLRQLETVLTIMGAEKPLVCLQSINERISSLSTTDVVEEVVCAQLIQSLVELDTLLDQCARQTILQARTDKSEVISARDVYFDTSIDACLRESRHDIQVVADRLLPMMLGDGLDKQQGRLIATKLSTVNGALQMLPLPEVSPLFESLGLVVHQLSFKNKLQSLADPASIQDSLRTLLVSIDDYLGCVLSAQPSDNQLLNIAGEALEKIMDALDIHSSTIVDDTEDDLPVELVESLLTELASMGQALANYRSQADQQSLTRLETTLAQLFELTHGDMRVPAGLRHLASSASIWFTQFVSHDSTTLTPENLLLLEEVQGFLPVLLNSGADDDIMPGGLDALLRRLEREAMDAPEQVLAMSEPLADDLSLSDIGSLTLNVDDDLLSETSVDDDGADLDETLQLVFQHECIGHLESIDESVRLALAHQGNSKSHLPNEKMLRALHTLTGSAQTINAVDVVAIVLPLQRASLALHREGRFFDAQQTRYIGELVVALRARLNSISSGESVPDAIVNIEERLGGFLSESVPGIDDSSQDTTTAFSIGSQIKSLEDVFAEESSEILDRLRRLIRATPFDETSLRDAQTLLHTLKGSARMAGKLTISECAHELESELQATTSAALQLEVLTSGFRSLHGHLLQSTARLMTHAPDEVEKGTESSRQSPEKKGFSYGIDADSLLELATDLSVNQVRLSEELKRLRGVCQDIDATSLRWRNLLQQSDMLGTPATTEMLADMEAVCLVMRNSLRQAEREQQQASRVSASLQQSLVRSRLCRVDAMQERLSDTISDMSKVRGVSARFKLSGGEIMIDRELFKQLAAPLEHLARNAVVHGIEPADQRLARNKSSTGVVTLEASVDGTDLVLQFEDDGRGISIDSLNRVLQERSEPAIDSDEQLQEMLLRTGFSTIKQADTIAGHGLGLSAVQAAVDQMNGQIQLQTAEHAGVRITLRLPQRMVVKQVVLVQNDDRFFGIPVVYVKSVRLSQPDEHVDCVESADDSRTVSIEQLLGEPERRSIRPAQCSFVSVACHEQSVRIGIDEIIGYREIVTQPLGAQLDSLKRYSDGSVLPAGQKVLILDLPALLENPLDEKRASMPEKLTSSSPVALIVDDSHTSRDLARHIVRQWGLVVNSSKDGLDALESVATESPDIIIVDLEMPRMDGFGFLRRLAQKYPGEVPPAIVVSHFDNQRDRQTAAELGAVRFLVKPYSESELHEAIEAAGLRLPDLTIA